jgi:DNA-binding response OmpR family regulator
MSTTATTVLIVEDDRKSAATLGLYLTREGFTPVTAGNGREALALFE